MKKEIELEDIIKYLEEMADECPADGVMIDKYFLKHTASALKAIKERSEK